MNRFTKCNVVMLPTEKASHIVKQTIPHSYLSYCSSSVTKNETNNEPQLLYFISDEPIKEGDWFLMNGCIIRQCKDPEAFHVYISVIEDTNGGRHSPFVCKKIIATTDIDLGLPNCSKRFIRKYCESNGTINEVLVEHELIGDPNADNYSLDEICKKDFKYNVKIQPKITKDNTITIRQIQETYTKEEVINMLWKYNKEAMIYAGLSCDVLGKESFDQWISENL